MHVFAVDAVAESEHVTERRALQQHAGALELEVNGRQPPAGACGQRDHQLVDQLLLVGDVDAHRFSRFG